MLEWKKWNGREEDLPNPSTIMSVRHRSGDVRKIPEGHRVMGIRPWPWAAPKLHRHDIVAVETKNI